MSELIHTVRHKDGSLIPVGNYTKNTAIKLMCTECMGFESNPKDCTSKNCPLYIYRGRKMTTIVSREQNEIQS